MRRLDDRIAAELGRQALRIIIAEARIEALEEEKAQLVEQIEAVAVKEEEGLSRD